MDDSTGRLHGTLALLIRKAVPLATLHGYGVLLGIQQITGGLLQIQQGSLTRTGRARLGNEAASWNRIADAISMALPTTAKEI